MTTKKARSMAGLPWIAAMAFFMQALDATILNTALPAIAQSLNRSPLAMQSAIISYTLTVAMLIPVSGWLADRFGTRRVFMLAVNVARRPPRANENRALFLRLNWGKFR
jgi:MFS family permease